MNKLIFIDTNILLDFYRYPQGSAVLPMLKHIDENHAKIITGNQIEMEYKKNRQKVIIKSIREMKPPKWNEFNMPVIISESQPAQKMKKIEKDSKSQTQLIRNRIERILKEPGRNDIVYKTAQRLFKDNTDLNLNRKSEIRKKIRFLAKKRFLLGYPPRKDSDLTIGDSVNWEWIIHCAKEFSKDIIIVSRDSDYGCQYNKEIVINDWLLQEFKSRVSIRRKIELTNKLAYAFKSIEVEVDRKEEENEDKLLNTIKFSDDSQTKTGSHSYSPLLEALLKKQGLSLLDLIEVDK